MKTYTTEWTIETVNSDGDIIEVEFFTTYPELQEQLIKYEKFGIDPECSLDIGLVKYYTSPCVGSPDRAYAYIEKGELDDEFDDGTKVPKLYKLIVNS